MFVLYENFQIYLKKPVVPVKQFSLFNFSLHVPWLFNLTYILFETHEHFFADGFILMLGEYCIWISAHFHKMFDGQKR
jgi:hypothetical protein